MPPTLRMPRTIDEPPTILLWRIDHFLPLLVGLIGGMYAGVIVEGTLAGFVLTHFYSRWEHDQPDGFALHLLYWWGIWPEGSRVVRNPFVRIYVP